MKKLITGALLVIVIVGFSFASVSANKTAGGGVVKPPVGGSPTTNAISDDTY